MTADALATAVMVIGPGQQNGGASSNAIEFCQSNGLQGYFVVRDVADGRPDQTLHTEGFPFATREAAADTNTTGILPTFLGAVLIFGLAIAAMAIGAIVANKPIKGSCGGLSTRTDADGNTACSLCSRPVKDCPERAKREQQAQAEAAEA